MLYTTVAKENGEKYLICERPVGFILVCRQMKKDKKYLMERLHCGIARVKRNNLVEQLKSPNTARSSNATSGRSLAECRNSAGQVSYDEMLPGSSEEEAFPKSK